MGEKKNLFILTLIFEQVYNANFTMQLEKKIKSAKQRDQTSLLIQLYLYLTQQGKIYLKNTLISFYNLTPMHT